MFTITKVRLLKVLVWSVTIYESAWRLDISKQRREIGLYWSYRNVLLMLKAITNSVECGRNTSRTSVCASCKLTENSLTVWNQWNLDFMVIEQGNVKVWRRKSFKDVYQVRLGNTNRGRECRHWTDDVAEWTGMKTSEAAAAGEDRNPWRWILPRPTPSPTLLMEDGTKAWGLGGGVNVG